MRASLVTLLIAAGCTVAPRRPAHSDLIDRLALDDRPQLDPMDEVDYGDDARRLMTSDALRQLDEIGLAAVPALIAHIDDRRPTQYPIALMMTPTVGLACKLMVGGLIDDSFPKIDRERFSFICVWDDSLPLWWRERSAATLKELQIEARLYGLAIAEHDGRRDYIRSFKQELEALGVDVEARAAPFRRFAPLLDIPESIEGLVNCLAIDATTYVERRFRRERFVRAMYELFDHKERALPLLVQAMQQPEMAKGAFEVIQRMIESIARDLYPRFAMLNPDNVASWWSARSTASLEELKREAQAHHLKLAERATFRSAADRDQALSLLRKG